MTGVASPGIGIVGHLDRRGAPALEHLHPRARVDPGGELVGRAHGERERSRPGTCAVQRAVGVVHLDPGARLVGHDDPAVGEDAELADVALTDVDARRCAVRERDLAVVQHRGRGRPLRGRRRRLRPSARLQAARRAGSARRGRRPRRRPPRPPATARRRRRIERARPRTSSRVSGASCRASARRSELPAELVGEVVVAGHRSSSRGFRAAGGALAQGGERAAGLGLHGADGDAEHVGGLGLAELLVVAQHHDRPGLAGQRLDERPQRGAAALVVRVVGRRASGSCVGGELAPLPGPPPQRVVLVDQDPADVGVDRVAVADPVPGQVELGERGLQEVLGLVPVPGEQVRRTQQAGLPRREVRRELGVAPRRRASTSDPVSDGSTCMSSPPLNPQDAGTGPRGCNPRPTRRPEAVGTPA